MKKIIIIFSIFAILTPALFAAGGTETTKAAISIALVTDIGGIDDKSFNQGTWEGVVRFKDDLKAKGIRADITYIQSASDAGYVSNLSTVADEGYQLVVAPGFTFADSIAEVSLNYPNTHFLTVDTVVGERDNVASAVFAEEQGSFLAGVAAGLRAKKDGFKKVGFIGGIDFDVIQRFESGFEAGVLAVDPSIEVLVEYAGGFADPQAGQTIASKLYDSGANVIFHAAGSTGNGLIKEAKDRMIQQEASGNTSAPVWAVGVDKDQYAEGIYNTDTNKSAILTSMVKRADNAIYIVAQRELEGAFPKGGVFSFDLKQEGVGLPKENPNLDKETNMIIQQWTEKIISGEYVVPTLPKRLR